MSKATNVSGVTAGKTYILILPTEADVVPDTPSAITYCRVAFNGHG